MNKEQKRNIEELLKGAECILIATDNGVGIVGTGVEVLTYYTQLTKQIAQNIDKEMLENAFQNAFKKPEELLDDIKGLLEKMKEMMGGKENDKN